MSDEHKEALARKVHHSKQRLDELTSQAWDAHKAVPQSAEKENKPGDQKAPHPLVSKPTIRCFICTVRQRWKQAGRRLAVCRRMPAKHGAPQCRVLDWHAPGCTSSPPPPHPAPSRGGGPPGAGMHAPCGLDCPTKGSSQRQAGGGAQRQTPVQAGDGSLLHVGQRRPAPHPLPPCLPAAQVAERHPAGVWLLKDAWAAHLGLDRGLPSDLRQKWEAKQGGWRGSGSIDWRQTMCDMPPAACTGLGRAWGTQRPHPGGLLQHRAWIGGSRAPSTNSRL